MFVLGVGVFYRVGGGGFGRFFVKGSAAKFSEGIRSLIRV